MEQIALNISLWIIVLTTLVASAIILWSLWSRSFLAEVINSFPLQIAVFNTLLLSIVFIFTIALDGSATAIWYLQILNMLCVSFLITRVALFSLLSHRTPGNLKPHSLRIGSFNKQIGTPNAHLIVEHAGKLNLDLLGISEVKSSDFKQLLGSKYPYSYNTDKRYGLGQAEFLLLSKYKILRPKPVSLDQFGNALRFEIKVNGKLLAVYIVHTTAPISPELYRKRNDGFEILANKMNTDKASHIIMFGDLNITPFSWVYRKFQRSIGDKLYNVTKGRGFNFTWSYFGLLSTQLDHMFASKNIHTKKFKVDKKLESDHNLIWADLDF